MAYKTRVTPIGTDAGIDIIAHEDDLAFEPPIIKGQVKSAEVSGGDPIVLSLYGKVDNGEFGLLITLGAFINRAKSFARNKKSNPRLIDSQELVDLIFEYYEQFDSKYRGSLPLKQGYVPEPLSDGEGEPPRDCRRLNFLRGWSHDKSEQVFPGSSGAGGSDGVGARA